MGISPDAKTIFGEITEVTGNMLNIKLAKMPEGGMRMPGHRGEMDPEMQEMFEGMEDGESREITMPDGSKRTITKGAEGNAVRMQKTDGDGPPEGAAMYRSADGSGDAVFQSRDGQTMRGNMQNGQFAMTLEYTGEEIEFIIPVGIPVLQQSMGPNGPEETEIALDKLKSGNIITIVYKSDGMTIDKILLLPAIAAKAE